MSKKIDRIQKTNVIAIVIGVTVLVMVAILLWISTTSVEKRTVAEGEDGKTSTKIEKIDAVTCESDTMSYPFFEFDNAVRKNLKIVVSLDERGVRTVDLQYALYYNEPEMIVKSEAANHAAMNNQFYESGLGSDAVGATYSILNDSLQLNLHQTGDKMTAAEGEFLLINGILEYNQANVMRHFEELGMSCVTTS